MQILIIQALLIAFFFYASVRVFLRYRANEISAGVTMSWILFWIIAAFLTAKPDITYFFARIVGIGRGADLVMYVALALIFYMLFRISVSTQKINKDITKLTRKIALGDYKEKFESEQDLSKENRINPR
ncbi:DUF2304 domain-containing protein [Patescibacteria group bacterium]|nr:DUF2304 domain-containing protein [Patescibacteria group bacterium]MBU1612961.1 DUF2304 domain-containing protein [Patescibacteria group bacterium]